MESNNKTPVTVGSAALERARILSDALSDAARRARFSMRSRRSLTGGGFQARRGEKIMRWAVRASFIVVVAIPTIVAAVYYGFVASDQYVVEAKFTVSSGEIPKSDSIGALTGIPAAAIIQDTQIVTNYIQSRAAVEALEERIKLRELYSRPDIDWWAGFDAAKPVEKLVKYWKHMVDASIEMPSGIIEFKVRAFTAEDAAKIGNAVLEISEALINALNERMKRDALKNARDQLERAAARLTKARIALETARNEGGLLDANKAADALNTLITETKSGLLQMEQEYSTVKRSVNEDAPQMRALRARIDTTKGQIANLESKRTGTQTLSSSEPTLATAMTKFAALDLEQNIAQQIYAGAVGSLEMAQLIAERKLMYINAFVRPVVPEEPTYPWRGLFTLLVLVVCLAVWGIGCGLAVVVRNHMA
jgi:capsular polysaccharide transport system permease protein